MCYIVGLSIFSLVLAVRLGRAMGFGQLKKRKKWLIIFEVFVQIMLYGRAFFLALTTFIDLPDLPLIVCLFLFILLTELIPFAYLVYSMALRLKAFKKTRKLMDSFRSSSTVSKETEEAIKIRLHAVGVDDLTYSHASKQIIESPSNVRTKSMEIPRSSIE